MDLPVVSLKLRGSAKVYNRGAPESTPGNLHPNVIDLTEKVFGRLEVIGFAGYRKHKNMVWDCVCVCGKTVQVKSNDLLRRKTASCGCLRSEVMFKQTQRNKKKAKYNYITRLKAECGSVTNYSKGCRCGPCKLARSRYNSGRQKARRLELLADLDEKIKQLKEESKC